MQWFKLRVIPPGNPNNTTDYALAGSSSGTCLGGQKICEIKANNNGFDHPVISQDLMEEMIWALQFHTNTNRVHLRS